MATRSLAACRNLVMGRLGANAILLVPSEGHSSCCANVVCWPSVMDIVGVCNRYMDLVNSMVMCLVILESYIERIPVVGSNNGRTC